MPKRKGEWKAQTLDLFASPRGEVDRRPGHSRSPGRTPDKRRKVANEETDTALTVSGARDGRLANSVIDLTRSDDEDDFVNEHAGDSSNGGESGTRKLEQRQQDGEALHLSVDQMVIFNAVVRREENIFFTGAAGTGKSIVVRALVRALRQKYASEPDQVAVLAPTGLAACTIGGTTIHRWAGIGVTHRAKEDATDAIKRISRYDGAARLRWQRATVMIIDEISMVDGRLFDLLSLVGSRIRKCELPFGGIQMVVTGDFLQLPPIGADHEEGLQARKPIYAFQAECWNRTIRMACVLTEVFRARDRWLRDTLNDLRRGMVKPAVGRVLRRLSRKPCLPAGTVLTELFATRREVDAANTSQLKDLPGSVVLFEAVDSSEDVVARLDKCLLAPRVLELKVGAPVILLKNLDDTLVNGSQGVVEGFLNEYEFDEGHSDTGIPPSPDSEEPDGTDDDGWQPAGASEGAVMSTARRFPVVMFRGQEDGPRRLHCKPAAFSVEFRDGREVRTATRRQVPLVPAWALSIHKSQGQSLDYVCVNLGRTWERGQAYVALSRARTMKGLQVLNFVEGRVIADHQVLLYYEKLPAVSDLPAVQRKPRDLREFFLPRGV